MYLPARVVLYLLGDDCYETRGAINPLAMVSGSRIIQAGDDVQSPEVIYVCLASELCLYRELDFGKKARPLFACANDLSDEELLIPDETGVLLFDGWTKDDIHLKIQELFMTIEHWNHEMVQSIMEKNLQKLLDSSMNLIGNSIMINDSNFSLIAFALNPENDDRELSEAVSTRAFGNDLINRFIRANVLWENKNQRNIEIKSSFKYSKYVMATYTVIVDDNYFLRIAMLFDHKPLNDALVDLFAMLLEQIKAYVKFVPGISSTFKESYGVLILDLIDGRVSDPAVIKMRAESCGMDPQSFISVYLVTFKGQPNKNNLNSLFEKLRDIWPDARIVPRDDDIVIVSGRTKKELKAKGFYHQFAALLEKYSAVCGFSSPYKGVEHMRDAFQQAVLAAKYGSQIHNSNSSLNCRLINTNEFDGASLFAYETYYIYSIFDHAYQENYTLFGNTDSMELLFALWINDREDAINDLQLLHEFLISGKRATETAENMHMHRNSVLYRIAKIEKQFNVDLSDPELCFKLLLAYRLLDYYGEFFFSTMEVSV
ncbi:MAG: helix-turn-helix domain-containing protein [Clostridiales bacterium]|nr:helix-turn-helix domain-containing protein [Clostridiales bacterium]